jgi:DNA-directed RNA polymerase specialized sigma24 family protein
MPFRRFLKKVSTGAAAELCVETDALEVKLDTLTLEKKVTGYFQQWRDPVNRYVVAAFGDPVEAEEITQEAFMQLYRQLHSGQSITNVRAWVFCTAHNLAVNRIQEPAVRRVVGRRLLGRVATVNCRRSAESRTATAATGKIQSAATLNRTLDDT